MRGLHWFRNDLRLDDNRSLAALTERVEAWLPVFVLDPELLARSALDRLTSTAGRLEGAGSELERGSEAIARAVEDVRRLSAENRNAADEIALGIREIDDSATKLTDLSRENADTAANILASVDRFRTPGAAARDAQPLGSSGESSAPRPVRAGGGVSAVGAGSPAGAGNAAAPERASIEEPDFLESSAEPEPKEGGAGLDGKGEPRAAQPPQTTEIQVKRDPA